MCVGCGMQCMMQGKSDACMNLASSEEEWNW